MLMRFFKNDQNTIKPMGHIGIRERLSPRRGRGKVAIQGPCRESRSGGGFVPGRELSAGRQTSGSPIEGFILPPLIERDIMITVDKPADGMLFSLPAVGLAEQRSGAPPNDQRDGARRPPQLVREPTIALMWCHLNPKATC